MDNKSIQNGDVFAVPLPDSTFLFGRVMLNIHATTKKRLFPAGSPLPSLGKALLVEMYEQPLPSPNYKPSGILVPGAFVEADEVGGTWPIISNVAIDVHDVRFPETMIGHMHDAGEVDFECGEIDIPIPITLREMESMRVLSTRHSAFLWPYICLNAMGRGMEIPGEYTPSCHLRDSDLRFSSHRALIYSYLPLNPNDSYYQQQQQLGLRLERLCE